MYSYENMHVHIQINDRKWAETTDYNNITTKRSRCTCNRKKIMQTTIADDTIDRTSTPSEGRYICFCPAFEFEFVKHLYSEEK